MEPPADVHWQPPQRDEHDRQPQAHPHHPSVHIQPHHHPGPGSSQPSVHQSTTHQYFAQYGSQVQQQPLYHPHFPPYPPHPASAQPSPSHYSLQYHHPLPHRDLDDPSARTALHAIAGANVGIGKHRVTTTLWEDEGTLCFQVDAKGVCVARRHGTTLSLTRGESHHHLTCLNTDNNMINGTKLLNVCQMSRGKRDGILKNEKERVVVKVGAMHLKGVWYVSFISLPIGQ
jgi:hypothetical protein